MIRMTAQRARLALWIGSMAFVCVIVFIAMGSLMPFAVGAIIAYALSPVVDRLMILVPFTKPSHESWRRGIAVLIVFLIFFGGLTALMLSLIPLAVEQISHFIEQLPTIIQSARDQSSGLMEQYRSRTPEDLQVRIDAMAGEAARAIAAYGAYAVQQTLLTVTSTVGFIFGLAILPFWMFYAMRDRNAVAPNLVRAAPAEVRADVRMMLSLADRLLGRYIRAQIILGVVVGLAVGVLLALLGVDLSLGLGVWAGVTELIPIIGPWIGAIPGIILIAAVDPSKLPLVALVYFMVQQLENNFLVPRIQGDALDMHPAIVILLLAVGGAAWGLLGLIIVIPASAILRELFWYLDRRLRGQTPEVAFAGSHVNGGKREEMPSSSPLPDATEVSP